MNYDCQGMAMFLTREQAEYVAEQTEINDGGNWMAVPCGHHFHVVEIPGE